MYTCHFKIHHDVGIHWRHLWESYVNECLITFISFGLYSAQQQFMYNYAFTIICNDYIPSTLSTISLNIERSVFSEHLSTVPLNNDCTLFTTAVEFTAKTIPFISETPSTRSKKIPRFV